MSALLIAGYAAFAIIVGIFAGWGCYGDPGETRPRSQIQPHNPRTAIAVGVAYGALWPVLVFLGLCVLIAHWFERGARER